MQQKLKSETISNQDRQAAFKKRMRSDGFVQTAVWVHSSDLEEFNKYISGLRVAHRKIIEGEK